MAENQEPDPQKKTFFNKLLMALFHDQHEAYNQLRLAVPDSVRDPALSRLKVVLIPESYSLEQVLKELAEEAGLQVISLSSSVPHNRGRALIIQDLSEVQSDSISSVAQL